MATRDGGDKGLFGVDRRWIRVRRRNHRRRRRRLNGHTTIKRPRVLAGILPVNEIPAVALPPNRRLVLRHRQAIVSWLTRKSVGEDGQHAHFIVNSSSIETRTATDCPSRVPGSKSHCLAAATASRSNPYLGSRDRRTNTSPTVPSGNTTAVSRTRPEIRALIASNVYMGVTSLRTRGKATPSCRVRTPAGASQEGAGYSLMAIALNSTSP